MDATERKLIQEMMQQGLSKLTPEKLGKILEKLTKGKTDKSDSSNRKGGKVSRKRGKKIMQGYKAGGKV